MYILGISCFFHDSAAALTKNGEIIAAAEEERFTRIKHDNNFPFQSISFCLTKAGINGEDLDHVIFYEKPLIKLDRILSTIKSNFPKSFNIYKDVFENWATQKLWIRDFIKKYLRISKNKILFYEHHFSHAASSYYCSEFNQSDLLTIDGVGEWTTTSFGITKNNKLLRQNSVDFPNSLGLFYSAFTEFLGFEVNEGEFKVMGMAPYGQPKYLDKIDKLFKKVEGLNFELDMSYFDFDKSLKTNLSNKFIQLFGDRRIKEEPFFLDSYEKDLSDQKFHVSKKVLQRSQYYSDIACSLQKYIEKIILGFTKNLQTKNKNSSLCYSGGVAYNCSANYQIIKSKQYKDIFIQPAAGDSGGALGCALALDFIISGKRRSKYSHTYLGKSFSNDEIKKYLEQNSINFKFYESFEEINNIISKDITNEKIIGWFQDSFEFGPRSLGNRSILADPRFFKTKKIVNSKIKFRELFRPFAPSVIDKYAKEYFELDDDLSRLQPFKFMLSTVNVREKYKNSLQAITHVDGTARVQIVEEKINKKYYNLISSFGDLTGIYCLLNTSFNRRGEPIVSSPSDAMATFNWTNIDTLVLNNFIINKN